MTGRHRKPPRFAAFRYYAAWTATWGLVAALAYLMFLMLKDLI